MIPAWLHELSIAYLLLGAVCAVAITIDVARHPQHMWIMNVVWPVTALFGTVWILWQYFAYGRLATHEKMHAAMQRKEESPNKRDTPFPIMVGNGALHCGSGCTLGDIVAEWLVFAVPAIAVAFGYHGPFRREDLRRLGGGLHLRLRLRHRLPVLHHRADARALVLARHRRRNQGGHAVADRLSGDGG